MKLKSFKKNKRLKNILLALGTIAILGGGIIAYKRDVLYQDNYSKIDKINQTSEIAYTVNGKKLSYSFPPKASGLKVSNIECKNGVTAEWDEELWGIININSNNNQKISCNIDFNFDGTLVNYVKALSLFSDEVVADDFGNVRYIGTNPNNYVSFNNELWRIIGVMKDIENEDGTKSDKIKLIRNESIGNYSFDNKSREEGDSTEWTDSALQKVLNEGAYYNRTSGDCLAGVETISCDFSSTGLMEEAKSMISKSVWNLGGNIGNTIKETYERERNIYLNYQATWLGNVGLMYPSDYGYATSGGATTDRNTCLNLKLISNWKESETSDCKNNDWLLDNNNGQWILGTIGAVTGSRTALTISYAGSVTSSNTRNIQSIYPVVYLDSKLLLEKGNIGSSDSPFTLKVN